MIKLTISEFDDLLYTATFLKYYWQVYCGMTDATDTPFPHSAFVRDFIDQQRLDEFSTVKRNTFNKIVLSNEQLAYLNQCCSISDELKQRIYGENNPLI